FVERGEPLRQVARGVESGWRAVHAREFEGAHGFPHGIKCPAAHEPRAVAAGFDCRPEWPERRERASRTHFHLMRHLRERRQVVANVATESHGSHESKAGPRLPRSRFVTTP